MNLQASGKLEKEISIYRCKEYYKMEKEEGALGECGSGDFISSRVEFPKL